ncbi:MAG TPA: ABC transporter ATP-binding protein [Eubacteriaceae bacterium]|nr:ABC transporter ATP-binding protein [Eubacteriaceae bacterium]
MNDVFKENFMDYSVRMNQLRKTYKIYRKPWHRVVNVFSKKVGYKEFHALKGITIDIPKGEAVGVLGKNGAGKSTMLKLITGVATPTTGTLEANGKIAALLELKSGFDNELTGIENIYLKALTMGMQKKEMDEQLDKIIEFADIGEHIHQPVRTYSSGMKARLGFAISVNVDPDILIVDEALSVGDDVFKLKCIERMEEFKKQGKTILFVSHSLFTVKSFCNKCMWIKDGELMDYGDTGEIVQKYERFLKEERAKLKREKLEIAKSKNTNPQIISKKEVLETRDFRFFNSNNEETKVFSFGEDIHYEFDYLVKRPIQKLKFCITIRDAEYNEIFGSDKQSDNHIVNSEMDKIHHLKVDLKNLQLLPGKYHLSGELWDDTGAFYVSYSNKRPFEIQGDRFVGTGHCFIEHDYENTSAKEKA